MKKTLLIVCLMLATSSMSFAATTQAPAKTQNCKNMPKNEMQRPTKRPKLDEILNLTEAQKVQARAIRKQGHAQMKPIMEKLKSKEEQKHLLMQNKNPGVKEVQALNKLNKEIASLKSKADAIRKKNNQQFEAILTEAQKKQFNEMKKNGRRDFEKNHPPMPPFGFGKGSEPQDFPQKGDFPPPPPRK